LNVIPPKPYLTEMGGAGVIAGPFPVAETSLAAERFCATLTIGPAAERYASRERPRLPREIDEDQLRDVLRDGNITTNSTAAVE
jgi:hypothetical protein